MLLLRLVLRDNPRVLFDSSADERLAAAGGGVAREGRAGSGSLVSRGLLVSGGIHFRAAGFDAYGAYKKHEYQQR